MKTTARRPLGKRLPSLIAALLAVPAAAVAMSVAATPSTAATGVTPVAGTTYQLVNNVGNQCLDVVDGGTGNDVPIRTWGCNGLTAQQFTWHSSNSQRKLFNVNSTRCVQAPASSGVQLTQYRCVAGQTNQAFTAESSGSTTYRLRNAGNNLCLAVQGGSGAAGAAVVTESCNSSTAQQWAFQAPGGGTGNPGNPQPATGLAGWATQNGGTTGGGSAAPVTVTSSSALTSALSGTSAKVIRISGLISVSGMVRVNSNTTIQGVGSGSGITGGGFTLNGASNVILRNLVFRNAADDSINVEGGSTNVWIDHNDLANGYDGLIDIKRGSDFITVSWNHLHDHDKSMLLGHSDDNASQDRGHLRVTYHHNWLDGTGQRHPRVRFGNPVHVYNNYYNDIDGYGVASTEGAGVLVERNYFENVEDPYHLGEGDSGPGTLVARENHLVNSGSGQTGGSVASIPYSYTAETASGVKSSVTAGAGTGKLGL